jgi:hypothetical protein
MLIVTIDLVPGGYSSNRRTVGSMRIANISNLADVSNYAVDVMEGANPLTGSPARIAACRVTGHDRRQAVWALPASPLHWWRTRRPQSFGRRDVKAIREALLGVEVNDVDWPLAVTGHPAIAIRVAVRHLHAYGMTSPVIDAVVSAVSCCALEGNHDARVAVSSALSRRKKIDPFCHELFLLWRAARF